MDDEQVQQSPAVEDESAFPKLKLGGAWGESITNGRADELERALQLWERESDHGARKGPFDARRANDSDQSNLVLKGSDVFWLAARGAAPVTRVASYADKMFLSLTADWLLEARSDSLSRITLPETTLRLSGANLFTASLSGAILNGADLSDALLDGANLEGASLYRANLSGTALEGANLSHALLSRADLSNARVSRANLSGANLSEANLSHADLRGVRLNVETNLTNVILTPTTELADVIWNTVPLARIAWETLPIVGDESVARERRDANGKKKDKVTRRGEYEAAVRAYRLLAVTLRSQGLGEHADRYAYRAQLMQRVVLRLQGRRGAAVGSWLLDVVSGYGYQPMRSVFTYALVVLAFAVAYFILGGTHGSLSWNEAIVVSMTAFHGRGFFGSAFQPGDPQAAVAAAEALVGLLIEITFIATFTQRFFAR